MGCTQMAISPSDNSPEATFNVISKAVKECNFKNAVPLLSLSIQEKPFGEDYSKLQNNCNSLISDNNCLSSCSSNENLFENYGYSCEKVCNADCNDKITVLEIGCIFNTRNYQKHTTLFEIHNIIEVSENKVKLNITRTRDFEFSQVADEVKVLDIDFIKEGNQWKLDSSLYLFE